MPRALLSMLLPLFGACQSLADRYGAGNRALSTPEGAMYFVVISPILQRSLNTCIPVGLQGAAPVLVLVAEVDAAGVAHRVRVEPDSPGTDCLRDALGSVTLPKPPLAPGASRFPIGLRVDTAQ